MRKIDLTVAGYIFNGDKLLLIHHKKLDKWLPVGGHIDPNETPDKALRREIKEEVNLEVDVIGKSSIPFVGNVVANLALPFHTNVHSVGNHDHYCLFYLCNVKDASQLRENDEVTGARWFSMQELEEEIVPEDVREIAKEAFRLRFEYLAVQY